MSRNLAFKIKYLAIKTFWFFGRPLQIVYWFLVRPRTRGVKCAITHEDGTFLLVKLNYGHRFWGFPGGGVGKHETLVAAAIREVREETGLDVQNLRQVGEYTNRNLYRHNTVTVYTATTTTKEIHMDPIEIADAGWYQKHSLPVTTGPSVTTILNMLQL